MTPISDLPYLEWTDPDTGAVTRIYADVVKDESPNLPAVVTQHAVETGANITDHYRKDLETVSITYFFSGSPIRGDLDPDAPGEIQPKTLTYRPSLASGAPLFTPGGLVQGATGAIGGLLGLGPPALPKTLDVLAFDTPPKPIPKWLERIRMFQSKGILVTAKTSMGPFENCAITSAKFTRSHETGDGGELALELQQIRSVTSDIALALPIPEEPRGLPKSTASANGAGEAGGGKASVLKSLFNKLTPSLGGSGL